MPSASASAQKKHGFARFAVATAVLVVALNLATLIPGFADGYTAHVYPVLIEPLSRLCDLAPLPLGELVMYVGALALLVGVAFAVAACLRQRPAFSRKVGSYWKLLVAVLLVVALLFTLNGALPFRSSSLSSVYGTGGGASLEQVEELRNRVVDGLNQAAAACPRDDAGQVVPGDDIDGRVAAALDAAGAEFDRLRGYYPRPKAALCSDVLEWMGIGGYTYPYTQEVTYNRYVSALYYPVLSAHELVHHKGYFMESDAEFLSFVALARSDDAVLRYSAYEHVCYYVEGAYEQRLLDELGQEAARERYQAQAQPSTQVRSDEEYDAQQRSARYESSVNASLEGLFSQPAHDVSQAGWDTQAQVLQDNAYEGVVGLLLGYYG
jgi:hypothetical protein